MKLRFAMSDRHIHTLLLLLLAGAEWACSSRSQLPEPTLPFTRTPDADFRSQAPPPAEPRRLATPSVSARRLQNGLSVQVVERHRFPTVSIAIVVRGAGRERRGEPSGLAGLCARMLSHGSRMPDGESAKNLRIFDFGPRTFVDEDAFHLRLDIPRRALPAGLRLVSLLLLHPAFPEAELRSAMLENLDGVAALSRQVTYQLRTTALERLYGEEHVRRRRGVDASNQVAQIGIQQLRAFYEQRYRAPATALIVTGDVSSEQVFSLAEQNFGGWRTEAELPLTEAAPSMVSNDENRRVVAFATGDPMSHVSMAVPGPGALHADYPAFRIAATSLAGLALSRGNLALSHHDAKSYGVRLGTDVTRGWSEAFFEFSVESHDLQDSLEIFNDLIEALRVRSLTSEELDQARTRILTVLAAALSSNEGAAAVLAELFAYGQEPSAVEDLRRRFEQVTVSDVQRVARTWFGPERVQTVIAALPGEAKWLRGAEWRRFDWRTVHIPRPKPVAK